jgi:Protein of unknown function (DUF3592)
MKITFKIIATVFIVLFPPILAWHTFVHPAISYFDARDWISTDTTSLTVQAQSRRGKTHTRVNYTFEHSGGEASGDTLEFWPGSHRNSIDPRLNGVSSSTVWYDPLNPQRSVLFRDFDSIGFAFGLIPCAFSGFSFWILFLLVSSRIFPIHEEAQH